MSDNPEKRSITVSGDAQVITDPDQVVISLGVETRHKNLVTAKMENNAIVQKLMDVAQRRGVEPRHVQVDFVNIEPRSITNARDKTTEVFYFVQKTIIITLGEVSSLESLMDDVLQVGVNHVRNVDFRTSQLRKYRDEARARALRAAQAKAKAMAAELDQTVGKPLAIREERSDWGVWRGWWGSAANRMPSQNVELDLREANAGDREAVAPGKVIVSAWVTVTFELE